MNNTQNNKVALIRASYSSAYNLFKAQVKTRSIVPPMGLMYIAAVLEKNNYNVKIFDCEADELTYEELTKQLKEFEPFIAGVSCATTNYWLGREIIKRIKTDLGCLTVMGGPHPTVRPEQVLQENPSIDFVVRREGEYTMLELVNRIKDGTLSSSQIKGLTVRKNGEIVSYPARPLIEDLDELPRQSYHLVPHDKYLHSVPCKGMKKMAAVLSSRGCPNQCTFCFRMFGRRVRFRDPDKVLDEVEYALRELRAEWVTFYDDTFTVNKKRAIDICQKIRQRGLKFDWQCFVRANCIDDDLMRELVASGCKVVSLGVESGNDEILKRVKKGTNVEMIREAVRIITKYDIEARGSFILGLPGETKKTVEDTFKLIRELPLNRVNVNVCTPYPGTELFQEAQKRQGIRLLSQQWKEFKRHGGCVIRTDELGPKELIEYQKEATKLFYTRPDVLKYHLNQFVRGERDMFYYRPLIFALKHALNEDKS